MTPGCQLGRESLTACTIDGNIVIQRDIVQPLSQAVPGTWLRKAYSLARLIPGRVVGCHADTAVREIIRRDRGFDELSRGENLYLHLISW